MPYFLATSAVASWLPPTSEVTSTSGMRLSASRCFCPNAPCPATQISISCLVEHPKFLFCPCSPGLRPGHPRLKTRGPKDVYGRDKPGHDALLVISREGARS